MMLLTYEVDTDHLAECDKPIAACPLCADYYGVVPQPRKVRPMIGPNRSV